MNPIPSIASAALAGLLLLSAPFGPAHGSDRLYAPPSLSHAAPAAVTDSAVETPIDERILLWPTPRITYAFDARVEAPIRALFRQGADIWQESTSWQLVEADSIRTAAVIIRPHASRCAASVGAPRDGAQSTVHLSPQCTLRSMVHEIGHVIGMQHEHQRPDRQAMLTLRTDTLDFIRQHFGESTYRTVVLNLQPIQSNPGQPHAFDEQSIMMYGSYPQREPLRSALMERHLPLFTRKDGSLLEASPARLSNKDIAQAELLATLATTLRIASPPY